MYKYLLNFIIVIFCLNLHQVKAKSSDRKTLVYVHAKKDALKLNDVIRLESNGPCPDTLGIGLVVNVDCMDDNWDGVRICFPLSLRNKIVHDNMSLRCYVLESLTTYFREIEALHSISKSSFLPYILNKQNPTTRNNQNVWSPSFMNLIERKACLNESQIHALKSSVNTEKGFCLIQGPFGTGKTKTIVSILNSTYIKQYEKFYLDLILGKKSTTRPKILVSAPSNVAIDIIVSRVLVSDFLNKNGHLKKQKPRIVRSGNGITEVISESSISLSSRIDKYINHPDPQNEVLNLRILIDTKKSEIDLITCQMKLFHDSIPGGLIPKSWEARLDDEMMIYFFNTIDERIQYEIPTFTSTTKESDYSTIDDISEYKELKIKLCTCVDFVYDLKNELNRYEIILNERIDKRKRVLIEKDIINTSDIVFTTLSSCSMLDLTFSFSIIDESCQATELSLLVALQKVSGGCILVGDPQQLQPTVKSKNLNILGISLFERLIKEGYPYCFLNQQYRMHPLISYFPRMNFYGGILHDGIKDSNHYFQSYHNISIFNAFSFINLSSSKCERNGTSYVNPNEAEFIFNMYTSLIKYTGESFDGRVAIITPYKKQVEYLKRMFDGFKVDINTIDSFQGGEKEIVFFSCVRTTIDIGFLKDIRRLNVALTRAKCGLYIIGNKSALEHNDIWYRLIEFSKNHDRYFSIDTDTDLKLLNLKPLVSSCKKRKNNFNDYE